MCGRYQCADILFPLLPFMFLSCTWDLAECRCACLFEILYTFIPLGMHVMSSIIDGLICQSPTQLSKTKDDKQITFNIIIYLSGWPSICLFISQNEQTPLRFALYHTIAWTRKLKNREKIITLLWKHHQGTTSAN